MDAPIESGAALVSLDVGHATNSSRFSHKAMRRISTSSPRKTKKRCPYCPFTSYYTTSVTVHMRRHTGEKPYRCLQCNKSFRDKSNFNSHVRRFSHTATTSPRIDSAISIAENIPQSVAGMPFVSRVYSESMSSMDQQDKISSSAMQSLVGQSQLYPITMKVNRRKPMVVRKKSPSQLVQSMSCSSEGENSESVENSLNAENLHAFQDNLNDDDRNLLHFKLKPPEIEEVKSCAEPSSSSHETTNVDRQLSDNDDSLAVNLSDLYSCQHCGIYFKNCILHTLHMGCHGYNDPFQCNTCGAECKDALEFHCHFARATHNGSF